MKKKLLTILLLFISLLCVGCELNLNEFEYGDDKFYLYSVGTYGKSVPRYSFVKKIDADMIFEPYSLREPTGYELRGCTKNGHWDFFDIQNENSNDGDSPVIRARYVCYSKEGMGDTKLNIYFNYTVASTGERVEEVWEVDFGQKPYKDDREK